MLLKVILSAISGPNIFKNISPIILSFIPVSGLLDVFSFDILLNFRIVQTYICSSWLFSKDMEQEHIGVMVWLRTKIIKVYFQIFRVNLILLIQYHLFDVQTHIEKDGYFEDEGSQASDQSVVGISLLVKVQVDRVTKHVMTLEVFFRSLFH